MGPTMCWALNQFWDGLWARMFHVNFQTAGTVDRFWTQQQIWNYNLGQVLEKRRQEYCEKSFCGRQTETRSLLGIWPVRQGAGGLSWEGCVRGPRLMGNGAHRFGLIPKQGCWPGSCIEVSRSQRGTRPWLFQPDVFLSSFTLNLHDTLSISILQH